MWSLALAQLSEAGRGQQRGSGISIHCTIIHLVRIEEQIEAKRLADKESLILTYTIHIIHFVCAIVHDWSRARLCCAEQHNISLFLFCFVFVNSLLVGQNHATEHAVSRGHAPLVHSRRLGPKQIPRHFIQQRLGLPVAHKRAINAQLADAR